MGSGSILIQKFLSLNLFSPSCRLCLAIMLIPVFSEIISRIFLALPPKASRGVVYNWTPSPSAVLRKTPGFTSALSVFGASRGGEWTIQKGQSVELTLFYFEFDHLQTATSLVIDQHPPEDCNVNAGFRFVGHLPPKKWKGPGGEDLEFNLSEFATPAGESVFVFKNVWLSHGGNRDIRRDRTTLIRSALEHRMVAGRFLDIGVFRAKSAESAWNLVQEEVTSKLVWIMQPSHATN